MIRRITQARWPVLLAALLSSGCLQAALDRWDAVTAADPSTGSTSWASTGEPATPTTSASSEIQTVTGHDETTGAVEETTTDVGPGTSTGPPVENTPPTVMLSVEPDLLDQAGKTALLSLNVSADVITVRLSMNGGEAVELTPADFPYTYEALSAKDNGMPHVFTAEVEDEEGLTATDDAALTVQLPASGVEKCLYVDDTAVGGSEISALVYTKTAIVAGGWRDAGDGRKATIWKLEPDTCTLVPGWYKSIVGWTEPDSGFAELESIVTAVAVDEQGKIAVGGNLIKNAGRRRYTALLAEHGGRLWEKQGTPGEEVSSVVFAPGDLVISGGWRATNNPPTIDAMFWTHSPDSSVFPWVLETPFAGDPVPDPNNWRSEWIRAMVIDPDGYLVVLGEREYRDGDFQTYTRAFLARFVPLGGQVGSPMTSPGDAYKHEAMYSLTICGDELIAGGWTRAHNDPNAAPQPLFRWVSNGVWLDKKLPELMPSTELRGAACDREGKVIGAGVRAAGGLDARVFAFEDPLGDRAWYETGTAGDDVANGVACDARGFCAWPGYRTVNGKKVGIVRVHHP